MFILFYKIPNGPEVQKFLRKFKFGKAQLLSLLFYPSSSHSSFFSTVSPSFFPIFFHSFFFLLFRDWAGVRRWRLVSDLLSGDSQQRIELNIDPLVLQSLITILSKSLSLFFFFHYLLSLENQLIKCKCLIIFAVLGKKKKSIFVLIL